MTIVGIVVGTGTVVTVVVMWSLWLRCHYSHYGVTVVGTVVTVVVSLWWVLCECGGIVVTAVWSLRSLRCHCGHPEVAVVLSPVVTVPPL